MSEFNRDKIKIFTQYTKPGQMDAKETKYRNKLSLKNKLYRAMWNVSSIFLFRPFKGGFFRRWRNLVLRVFGADIAKSASVHASVKVWMPSNLKLEELACISDNVDCYNVNMVHLGKKATVSQRAFLCTASHNISSKEHELITAPIYIGDYAWVCAESFISMGTTIGEGGVTGARSVVFKDVEPWTVVGGNPAKFIKKRVIKA